MSISHKEIRYLSEGNTDGCACARFAASNLSRQAEVPGYNSLIAALAADDEARVNFLKACLLKLGLEVSQETSSVPSLSRLHLSALYPADVGELLHAFNDIISKDGGEEFIRAENDIFHIEKPQSRWSMGLLSAALDAASGKTKLKDNIIDHNRIIKRIAAHEEAWPEPKETPYFNHAVFYSSLQEFRDQDDGAETWGDSFMYGEIVTSTNTLLDKYVMHGDSFPGTTRE